MATLKLLAMVVVVLQLSGATGARAVERCVFNHRVPGPGDEATQELRFGLSLKVDTTQGGQLVNSVQRKVDRRQVRTLSVLKSNATSITQVQVTFNAVEQQTNEAAVETDPTLEPIAGKTYIVERVGEKLLVTDGQGKQPPDDEAALVAAAMEAIGRPNPLGQFLHGRTLAVGGTLKLPNELARDLLGFADTRGEVTRCDVTLTEIRSIGGAKCAVLETVIEGESKASGMSMLLKGELVVVVDTCRTLKAELSGPVAVREEHGPAGAKFAVQGGGTLSAAIHVEKIKRR